jgi:hypothetical protein
VSLAPTALGSPVTGSWRYWTATSVIAAEGAVGGAMDLLHLPPFFPVLLDLGYPAYLATILGIANSGPNPQARATRGRPARSRTTNDGQGRAAMNGYGVDDTVG